MSDNKNTIIVKLRDVGSTIYDPISGTSFIGNKGYKVAPNPWLNKAVRNNALTVITQAEYDELNANFDKVNGKPKSPAEKHREVNPKPEKGLNMADMKAALKDKGIDFKGNISKVDLQALYEEHFLSEPAASEEAATDTNIAIGNTGGSEEVASNSTTDSETKSNEE